MIIDGVLAARVVEGSFDAQEFHNFVAKEVFRITPSPLLP